MGLLIRINVFILCLYSSCARMPEMDALGLDAGASSSKWTLKLGTSFVSGRTAAMTGHVDEVAERERVQKTMMNLAQHILAQASPTAIVAGIAGLDSAGPAADFYKNILAQHFLLPNQNVFVMNDMDLAYQANFEPGQGIVLYAGTGAIAYHIDKNKKAIRAGGHGYLVDDLGGGFWMGQAVLRAAMKELDSGTPGEILHAVFATTKQNDWPGLRTYIYSGGRRTVASLAPLLFELGNSGNEPVNKIANEILLEASQHLCDLLERILFRLNKKDLPIVLLGGAFLVHPVVAARLMQNFPTAMRGSNNMAEAASLMAEKLLSK